MMQHQMRKKKTYTKTLHSLSDASGQLKLTEVATGSIKKAHLKSDDVYIVDLGNEVFVWVGKGASKKEKALAIQYAALYLKHHGRPYGTPVARIQEGGEPSSFWKHFD